MPGTKGRPSIPARPGPSITPGFLTGAPPLLARAGSAGVAVQVASLNRVVNTLAEPTIADADPHRCRYHEKTRGLCHAGSDVITGAIAAVV
jgi:hypothetical protein